jgi:glucose dehydrogenase
MDSDTRTGLSSLLLLEVPEGAASLFLLWVTKLVSMSRCIIWALWEIWLKWSCMMPR